MNEISGLCSWVAGLYRRHAGERLERLMQASADSGYTPLANRENNSPPTVHIVDVLSSRTIIVSWQHATGGRYGYQTWTRLLATRDGRCAFSGSPIRKGDPIFHPRSVGVRQPINTDAMILAAQVETTSQWGEVVGKRSGALDHRVGKLT